MRSISFALVLVAFLLSLPTGARAGTAVPWLVQAQLYGTPDVTSDRFGSAVATSGTRIAVGAPGAPCPPPSTDTLCGTVHVFNLINNQWVQEAALTSSPPQLNAEYGYSVDIDGDWLIVGAPYESRGVGGTTAGNVYLYHFQNNSWLPIALGAPVEQNGFLGSSVAISSSGIAVAGMPGQSESNPPQHTKNGLVTTYTEDVNGDWNYESALRASTESDNANFGSAVALYVNRASFLVTGYTLAVGAPGTSVLGNANAGEGYVYNRVTSDTSWTERAFYSLTTTAHEGESFGTSASVYGNVIAFGVLGRQIANGNRPGSVYVVRRNTSDWSNYTAVEIASPSTATDNFFGASVALWQNTLFIGAPDTDLLTFHNGMFVPTTDAGNVYEFDYVTLLQSFWQQADTFTAPDASAHAHFGNAVAYRGVLPAFGAPYALPNGDTTPTDFTGAVYAYQRDDIFTDGFDGQ